MRNRPGGHGRTFGSGPLFRLHRPVGFRLITEGREGASTPITFFRVGR